VKAISSAGAILGLHVLVSVHRWLPEFRWRALLVPGPELLLLLGVILLTAPSSPKKRLAIGALTAPFLLFSLGEGFTQVIFSQPFRPTVDIPQLVPLLSMMTGGRSGAGLAVVLVVITLVFLAAVTALLIGAVQPVFARRRPVPGVMLLLFSLAATAAFGARVLPVMMIQQTILASEEAPTAVAVPTATRREEEDFALPGLRDRDIYLVVIESYGNTLFSSPDHRALTVPFLRGIQMELVEDGFSMATKLLESPTSGGRSWLADATLLTGMRVNSQERYDRILEGSDENLTHFLGLSGYRRVFAAPGTTSADQRWRERYEFDRYLLQGDFGYRGPLFSFGAMPDQYMLSFVNREILSKRREDPLFAMILTVSSHVPFDRVPHYFEDWDAITDGSEFKEVENPRFRNNWLTGGEYPEGYTASIRYVFRTLSDFFRASLPGDGLIILVGDHQPRLPIREKGSTRAVPMNVLARDAALIERFVLRGFTPGLIPPDLTGDTVDGMESFYPLFLNLAIGETPNQRRVRLRLEALSVE
jgi:hypothetical protein